MEINHVNGLIAVLLAILCFYISIYAVVALNVGWRFGYWVSAASFGGVMVLLSLFWCIQPVGPLGKEPRWIPVAAAKDAPTSLELDGQPLTVSGSFRTPGENDPEAEQNDPLKSSIGACLTTDPEELEERDKEACEQAQALLPSEESLPKIEGERVVPTYEPVEIGYADAGGAAVGRVKIQPLTRDPRLAKDPKAGMPLGDEFYVAAVLDKGSLRVPAYLSLLIFLIYTGVHLLGLHRAEKRKLSPILG